MKEESRLQLCVDSSSSQWIYHHKIGHRVIHTTHTHKHTQQQQHLTMLLIMSLAYTVRNLCHLKNKQMDKYAYSTGIASRDVKFEVFDGVQDEEHSAVALIITSRMHTMD